MASNISILCFTSWEIACLASTTALQGTFCILKQKMSIFQLLNPLICVSSGPAVSMLLMQGRQDHVIPARTPSPDTGCLVSGFSVKGVKQTGGLEFTSTSRYQMPVFMFQTLYPKLLVQALYTPIYVYIPYNPFKAKQVKFETLRVDIHPVQIPYAWF